MIPAYDRVDADNLSGLLRAATEKGEQVFLAPKRVTEIDSAAFLAQGMVQGVDYEALHALTLVEGKLKARFVYTNPFFLYVKEEKR